MAIRKIIKNDSDWLKKKSRDVTKFDKRLHTLIDDMIETMHDENGAGIAAVQVGVLRRVCVVVGADGEKVIELVNPVIIEAEGNVECGEGCLSVPGIRGIVARPEKVTVRAFDRNGTEFETKGEGIVARAFCHEIDHLDGVIFTSKVIRFIRPDEDDEYEDYEEYEESEE